METKWWQDEVVYQIYPKSFYDSNSDGIGDLKGITQKLDYLEELGITMIWICPIFSSPMVDNGYDISDFEGINPEFGTMDDFDQLLEEAKKRHIKIILDLVINHTSDEHLWFQEALKNPTSKYRDYYIFKPGIEGNPPNNWRSIFGGSVWEKVPDEDLYYLHVFDKKQPDLNWENKEMRQELYGMINRWLDKGVAGFRIDSITFIKKDNDYASLPPDGADGLVSCKHKTRNRPGIEDFLNELKANTFEKYDAVTVGEAPGVKYEDFNQFIGKDGYFSMIFDFHYADIDVESGSDWFKRTNWTIPELKELLFRSQKAFQEAGWGANFLENHDQPRVLSKMVREAEWQTPETAKTFGMLYFFLRGTPFIYQGQELGMKNFNRSTIGEFNDISSIDNYHRSMQEGFSKEEALQFVNLRSRDNTRTPFPWNNEQYGGFTSGTPWLGMTEEYPEIHAANNSVYTFYQQLIQLRQNSELSDTFTFGDIREIKDVPEEVIAYERLNKDKSVTVLVNLSTEKKTVLLNRPVEDIILYSQMKPSIIGSEIVLEPYQGIAVS
ncbi:alpha-glucosidase [Oceanobacillus timonensis]|uniref:alpha-glucosidase n=1 Tax=Oceanobacillus timonensis TaxID=1926285 RepID=UPI001C4DDCBF|nr:alpha-glucosidase [Oceanobacillus timonensis]